jgi:hypothetical protein
MRRISCLLLAALLLFFSIVPQIMAENDIKDEVIDYEPYRRDEFPDWAHNLRRFEIILIGSLPFTFFFSNIGFDTYAYASRGYDERYLPLFFGVSPEKEEFRDDTKFSRFAFSISFSAGIALLDYFLGKRTQ